MFAKSVRGAQPVYLVSAAVIWAGIFFATAVVLNGTPYFAQLLPILGGGAVWFIILVPAALFTLASTHTDRYPQAS